MIRSTLLLLLLPFVLVLSAAILGGGCYTAATPTPAYQGDIPKEIVGLMQEHATLWGAGDIVGFTNGYADDCIFLSPSGVTRGRAEVLARYQKRYPGKAAMGTLAFELLDVRTAVDARGHGSVAVSGRWKLTYPDKPELSGLTLVVFHGRPGAWLIVQDASM